LSALVIFYTVSYMIVKRVASSQSLMGSVHVRVGEGWWS
jgi:hypothetical protein